MIYVLLGAYQLLHAAEDTSAPVGRQVWQNVVRRLGPDSVLTLHEGTVLEVAGGRRIWVRPRFSDDDPRAAMVLVASA